jgi:hypothetical protein
MGLTAVDNRALPVTWAQSALRIPVAWRVTMSPFSTDDTLDPTRSGSPGEGWYMARLRPQMAGAQQTVSTRAGVVSTHPPGRETGGRWPDAPVLTYLPPGGTL